MNVLFKTMIVALLAIGLTACGGIPKEKGSPERTVVVEKSSCPGFFDVNAMIKQGYPDAWYRQYREPPTVYPLYTCEWMQPMIQWARSANRYPGERTYCNGGHTSFTCYSERGPSGWSPRKLERQVEGRSRIQIGVAERTLSSCADSASERRELHVSVSYDGWHFVARQYCYW